jgi:hypothetical protein
VHLRIAPSVDPSRDRRRAARSFHNRRVVLVVCVPRQIGGSRAGFEYEKRVPSGSLVQIWFAAVALVVAAAIAVGAEVTVGTGAMLLALCLVPPVLILMLWPGVQAPTIEAVSHDAARRG